MTNQQGKNIWILIGHPRQLPLALVLSKSFSDKLPCHLVISRHKYWKTINLDEYRGSFASITLFEPIYHTHSLKELFRAVRQIFRTKAAMRKLPVGPDDVLISLEVWNYIENLMTTVWRQNKQLLIHPDRITPYISFSHKEVYAQKNYYVSKSGYLHFLLDKLLGLKKQNFLYWIAGGMPRFDHGIAYSKPVENYYDKVFRMKSVFSKNLQGGEIYYPHYLLRDSESGSEQKKMVVFFLSGHVTDPGYNDKVNQILQNLRRYYGEKYELHLRLHPNQPDSDKKFDCSGWNINREDGNAQIFLMRHANRIQATFTDKSTGQHFPLNMGFPSYSYHRVVGLDQYVVEAIDKAYQDAPNEFFMSSLSAIPQDYEPARHGLDKANSSIKAIYQAITSE